MVGHTVSPATTEQSRSLSLPIDIVQGLVDAVEESYLVSDRKGTLLLANEQARKHLTSRGFAEPLRVNLFADVLCVDSGEVFSQIEGGQQDVKMILELAGEKYVTRIRWMADSDWLVVQFATPAEMQPSAAAATQLTVSDLLRHERKQ